jgi:hypothetical protein
MTADHERDSLIARIRTGPGQRPELRARLAALEAGGARRKAEGGAHPFHLPEHGFGSTAELRAHLREAHGIPEAVSRYAEGMRHIKAHEAEGGNR